MFQSRFTRLGLSIFMIMICLVSCQPKPDDTIAANSSPFSTPILPQEVRVTETVHELLPEINPTLPVNGREESQVNALLEPTGIEATQFGESISPVTNPTWSHDDKWVAFRNEDEGVWVVDTSTWSNPKQVCPSTPVSNLVWSSDDLMLAYSIQAACTTEETCSSREIIQQCEVNTGTVSLLPGLETTAHAIFDWQEEQMLIELDGSLALYNRITSAWTELALPGFDALDHLLGTLTFVDDTHVIYMTSDENPVIQIVNINTLEVVEVIPNDIVEHTSESAVKGWSVAISPDTRWISWLSKVDSSSGNVLDTKVSLKIFDRESRETTTLLTSSQFPGFANVIAWTSPSWSLTSDQLIFMAERQIWILKIMAD